VDDPAPRSGVPRGPTDADIIHAIQMRVRDDRDWAIAWALLKLTEAIRETRGRKALSANGVIAELAKRYPNCFVAEQ
jgi:hypothetical protein